jgi:hypothetical protein
VRTSSTGGVVQLSPTGVETTFLSADPSSATGQFQGLAIGGPAASVYMLFAALSVSTSTLFKIVSGVAVPVALPICLVASYQNSLSIVVSSDGAQYVGDSTGVYKRLSTSAGGTVTKILSSYSVLKLAMSAADVLYVLATSQAAGSYGPPILVKITPSGVSSELGSYDNQQQSVIDISMHPSGSLYVFRMTSNNMATTVFAADGTSTSSSIARDWMDFCFSRTFNFNGGQWLFNVAPPNSMDNGAKSLLRLETDGSISPLASLVLPTQPNWYNQLPPNAQDSNGNFFFIPPFSGGMLHVYTSGGKYKIFPLVSSLGGGQLRAKAVGASADGSKVYVACSDGGLYVLN